jgi:lipid-binding SYLF domain-containing protein
MTCKAESKFLVLQQVGMGWSGVVGTGLVIGQKDGAWTSPSAISLAGVGWGLQLGGSVSDILIVLRNRCPLSVWSVENLPAIDDIAVRTPIRSAPIRGSSP